MTQDHITGDIAERREAETLGGDEREVAAIAEILKDNFSFAWPGETPPLRDKDARDIAKGHLEECPWEPEWVRIGARRGENGGMVRWG